VGMISPSMYYQTSYSWLFLLHTRQVSWLKVQRLLAVFPICISDVFAEAPLSQWRVRTGFAPVSLFTRTTNHLSSGTLCVFNCNGYSWTDLYYISSLFTSIFYHL